jgi:hypothetical protein
MAVLAPVSVGAICNAIAASLALTVGITRTQSYNQLTEGMNTFPTLQVYPDFWEVSAGSETDRHAFVDAAAGIPGLRISEFTIFCDLYVRRRSQLAQDWGDAVDLASLLHDRLDTEGACPHFGLAAIRSFHWTAQRVVFEYGRDGQGQPLLYTGFRFTLTVRVF